MSRRKDLKAAAARRQWKGSTLNVEYRYGIVRYRWSTTTVHYSCNLGCCYSDSCVVHANGCMDDFGNIFNLDYLDLLIFGGYQHRHILEDSQ